MRKTKFQRFLLRLKVAYRILFKEKHGICIFLKERQLVGLIKDNTISDDIGVSYFGMMEHQMGQVIKICAGSISDTDIICSKAEFDVKVIIELSK